MIASRRFIVLLAATIAVTPMAVDLYLPAIPTIAADFLVDDARIAVTVSLYMFGLVLGQLVAGPLSDRFGRKPVMLAGLWVFALASALISMTESWQGFWALRVLQALSGGVAVVGVPAIVRDRASGKDAAKMLAAIGLIMVMAPAAAPALGSIILALADWRWMFIFLAAYALLVSIAVLRGLPSAKSASPSCGDLGWVASYLMVLKNRQALGYMLAQGCAFGVMLTFVVNASYLYQVHFELSNTQFSTLFTINILAMAILNRVNVYWLNRHDVEHLALRGIIMQGCGALWFLGMAMLAAPLPLVALGIVLVVGSQGVLMPNSTAASLKPFAAQAGVASATLGSMRYLLGASISGFSSLFQHGSIWPMAGIMVAGSIGALAAIYWARGASENLQYATP